MTSSPGPGDPTVAALQALMNLAQAPTAGDGANDDPGMRPAAGLQADPDTARALQTVLTSHRPDRYKALTIACQRDHVVGRVYRTAVGLVLVFARDGVKQARSADLAGYGPVQLPPVEGPRAEHEAWRLDPESGWVGEQYRMQCRCSSPEVYDVDIFEAINAGKKRLRVSSAN